MENKETPLQITGISEDLYTGFWLRLWASLLDCLIVVPVIVLVQYLNSFGKNVYFYTCVPNLIFGLWYFIYLPKKYGGTPGKLIAGITIIKLDGESIGWKEATLRYIIYGALTLTSIIITISALQQADEVTFMSYSWWRKSLYLQSLSPRFFKGYSWATNIWICGEFIVFLANKRKRAVHDFIAGTVVVKGKYLKEISQDMNAEISSIGGTKNI